MTAAGPEAVGQPVTAGLVLIGDELLSGKVRDSNGPYLVTQLRRRGVDLCEVHVVSDDVEAIVEAVNLVRNRRSYCFTSGGIGPTHDDVTMEGVAAAFGMRLEERADLLDAVDMVFGTSDSGLAWRKMAVVPEGCVMRPIGTGWPVYTVKNVFVLPGIPEIFRRQLDALLDDLAVSTPVTTNVAFFKVGEGELTRPLTELADAYAGVVSLGSYPVLGHVEYQVKVTLDSRDMDALAEATRRLVAAFPPEALHDLVERVESGEA